MRVTTFQGIFMLIISDVRSNVDSEVSFMEIVITKILETGKNFAFQKSQFLVFLKILVAITSKVSNMAIFVSLAACCCPSGVGGSKTEIHLSLKHVIH